MTALQSPHAQPPPPADAKPVLVAEDVKVHFPIRKGVLKRQVGSVKAVDGVSLHVTNGETLGIVGESGCGKSTFMRALMRLVEPTGGRVLFEGVDILKMPRNELRRFRRNLQIVFQDPYAALDPRMMVRSTIEEPLQVNTSMSKAERSRRVDEVIDIVGLSRRHADRYPHEFSGGQRQRIGIARALALSPKVLLLDEPVSALDVSIQAQVLNLFDRLQQELGLGLVFVSHDLSVVNHIAHRIMVMYLGKVMEIGNWHEITRTPAHPYTQALLSAVPVPDPAAQIEKQALRVVAKGELPSPANPPSGCVFRTRCPKAQEICAQEVPELVDRGQGHPVACHFAEGMEMHVAG